MMENAIKLIKEAKEIAVFGGKNSLGDIFGAVSVLTNFLKNIQKKSYGVILQNDFQKPDFLTLKEGVFYSLDNVIPYVILIDKNQIEISEIAFNTSENEYLLELYLQKGSLTLDSIKIFQKKFAPDLIITVGVSDRSELIEFKPQFSQVFFDTPIINIDNKIENTRYGQVNLVYLTKSTKCEIVFELLRLIDELSMSPAHSTNLLGGIMMETKNFTSPKTNPSTFETAARLIERGADYKLIIEKLYQTKSFSVLKLTGFLLSKLTILKDLPISYATISFSELNLNDYSLKDLPSAIEEIENNFLPGFIIAVFYEGENKIIKVLIYWTDNTRIMKISKIFQNSLLKKNFLVFNTKENLKESAEKVIALLKKEL